MNYKDILELYAKYNKHANGEMLRILGGLPESRINEAVGSYYKSIAGMLGHSLRASSGSLKRMADAGFHADIILQVLASLPQVQPSESLFSSLAEYVSLRGRVDDAIIAVCAAASNEELDRSFGFVGRDNQPRKMTFGGNLLALFTHETHHRGGVSTILDGWGVDNDWSSLMRFLFI